MFLCETTVWTQGVYGQTFQLWTKFIPIISFLWNLCLTCDSLNLILNYMWLHRLFYIQNFLLTITGNYWRPTLNAKTVLKLFLFKMIGYHKHVRFQRLPLIAKVCVCYISILHDGGCCGVKLFDPCSSVFYLARKRLVVVAYFVYAGFSLYRKDI